MIHKKTLVIGASLKSERYSNKAIKMLIENGVETVAIGLQNGQVAGVNIINSKLIFTSQVNLENIHTVTLYLNSKRQVDYYNYIINLKPKRVIFNPGTKNEEFYKLLSKHNIKSEVACTLVLLRMKVY